MNGNEKHPLSKWTPVLLAAVAVAVIVGVVGISAMGQERNGGARSESISFADAARSAVCTEEGCALVQTFRFLPCGHQVTRRLSLPDVWVGANFDALQQHYDRWTIETFSAHSVTMSREENIYCPMHLVLMADEAGRVCIFKNVYGDGMAFEKETDYMMDDFDEETQKMLFDGMGFDDEAALERWLRQWAS